MIFKSKMKDYDIFTCLIKKMSVLLINDYLCFLVFIEYVYYNSPPFPFVLSLGSI